MYFEDLSMRRSINWASKWRVSLIREDWADKCSLCFAGFAYKLAVSLVNGIKINVHSITLLCLCLNHVWTLHLWINQNIEVVFHRTQRGWKLKSCVEIKSMWSTAFETCNLSVVILLACCFNALFTGVNHKNYNFLACDWFKNVLFSTNSLPSCYRTVCYWTVCYRTV